MRIDPATPTVAATNGGPSSPSRAPVVLALRGVHVSLGPAAQVEALPEVQYLVVCAGSFDILAEVIAEDDDHLLSIVGRRLRAIPGVRSTDTFVYLKLRKQSYAWGTR